MFLLRGAVRRVVTYPSDILRVRCEPISDPLAPSAVQLVADLLATVRSQEGLGLAAPQIGEPWRAFVMRTPVATTEQAARRLSRASRIALTARAREERARLGTLALPFTAVVNPVIVARGGGGPTSAEAASPSFPSMPATAVGYEACLSIPGVPALVRRSTRIDVRYVDPLGGEDGRTPEVVEARLEGLPAVVFQHELDHLDGVLITDRDVQSRPALAGSGQEGGEERGGYARVSREEALDAAGQRFRMGLMRFYNDGGELGERELGGGFTRAMDDLEMEDGGGGESQGPKGGARTAATAASPTQANRPGVVTRGRSRR
jgi:peptide deformylase